MRHQDDFMQGSSIRGRTKSVVPIPRRAGGIMMRGAGQGLPMRQRRLSNFRLPSLRRSRLSRNSRSLDASEFDEEEQEQKPKKKKKGSLFSTLNTRIIQQKGMIAEDQDGEDTQDDEDGKKRIVDTKRFTTISPNDASVVTNKKGLRSAKPSSVITAATREKL